MFFRQYTRNKHEYSHTLRNNKPITAPTTITSTSGEPNPATEYCIYSTNADQSPQRS
jgi:hypothetical protein